MKLSKYKITPFYVAIICTLLLSACASVDEQEADEVQSNKPDSLVLERSIIAVSAEKREKAVNNLAVEEGQAPVDKKQVTEKVDSIRGLTGVTHRAPKPPIFDNNDKVTVSVDSMMIVEFIHYIYGDLLNLNYVIASQLQGDSRKVSLNLSTAVEKSMLYSTSEQLLDDNDIAILRKDNIFFFQKKDKNKRYKNSIVGIGRSINDVPDTTGEIIQVIPYIYTNSRSLNSVIKKLTGVKVQIDAKRKIVMVEGSRSDVLDVLRVLRMLDVPSSTGKEIRLINLAYIAPDTLVKQVSELLINDGYQVGRNQDVSMVPMPRLGAVVVYAVSEDAVERVELWSKKLDVAVAGNEAQFYVYRPQFNKAVDLQSSVGPIIDSILLAGAADKKSTGTETKGVKTASSIMSVDEVQNALIFYTTSEKYRKIHQLLEKLDLLPGQVILDIVIAEVTLSDDISSGIDWFYNSEGASSSVNKSLDIGWESSAGTFSLSAISGDWRMSMNYLEKKTKVRVLAKPFLIVKDGESASISSGDQVPTIVQTSTSDSDNVTNSIQYVSTGIQVSVTPTINAKGLINLEISMTSSASKETDGFEVATPTITNRTITTNIFTGNGQTVALGGLIREDLDGEGNQVPFFGDIPYLGKLFKADSDKYTRSELIMLITTKIVKNTNEIDDFASKILDLYSFPLGEGLQSKGPHVDTVGQTDVIEETK